MKRRIELGVVYRDEITGFVGTATGRAEYLHSTPSVRIVANTGQDDEKERWVAESQLVPHDDSRVGFGKNPP